VLDIFQDMTDEKVDAEKIKALVNKVRIKQVVEVEGALDTLSFNNFLRIANMYLHESQHEDEISEAAKIFYTAES